MRYLTLIWALWVTTLAAVPQLATWAVRPAARGCHAATRPEGGCCRKRAGHDGPRQPAKERAKCPMGICNPFQACACCGVVVDGVEVALQPAWPDPAAENRNPAGPRAVDDFAAGWWQPPEKLS